MPSLSKMQTPLQRVGKNLFAKLEGFHRTGSVKDRSITACVNGMLKDEKLVPGQTLALCTSGSAGVSLLHAQEQWKKKGIEFDVKIFMPEAYVSKATPQRIVDTPGVVIEKNPTESTESRCLCPHDADFLTTHKMMQELSKEQGWAVLDQHYDVNNKLAHESTAQELLKQLPQITDVVCTTGTGGTAAGLRQFLPDHITVHSRPAMSGTIDGLTDVRRYDNFCDPQTLAGYCSGEVFDPEEASGHQKILEDCHGIRCGPSGGAAFALSTKLAAENPDACVAFICADGKNVTVPEKKQHGSRGVVNIFNGSSRRSFHSTRGGLAPHVVGGSYTAGYRDFFSRTRSYSSTPASEAIEVDFCVVGGGPVGASAARFLGEHEQGGMAGKTIGLVHDPTFKGAHEDWSRLARLSFDGPREEFDMSKRACELLEEIDEVCSYQSGAQPIPIRPGMLFVASPGTALAQLCERGESYGDTDFIRRDPKELESIYPGNEFALPAETLCWSHPTGLCVSPLELASATLRISKEYGVQVKCGRAAVNMTSDDRMCVTIEDGPDVNQSFIAKHVLLLAGASNKELLEQALTRHEKNEALHIKEFDDTYITAISTVRYAHVNHPAEPAEGSGHVVPPIVLGQLDVPELVPYQANFSIVAEEMGNVLKTRLSGSVGTEVVKGARRLVHEGDEDRDAEMAQTYQRVFGTLFPFLATEKALDFNRCLTYRNHGPQEYINGASLIQKSVGANSSLITTLGCYGVGVKFGPALGKAAAAHLLEGTCESGMYVAQSGDPRLSTKGGGLERAW